MAAQKSVIELLAPVPVVVDGQACERGIYLIVETRGEAEAALVSDLVLMTDTAASLIHQTSGVREGAKVS